MKCDSKMTFEECELFILRNAVDKMEKNIKIKKFKNPEVDTIINIVETFLKKKKRMCYGGTAINNILPKEAQFYDRNLELPDYDFFSPNPIKDSESLANIYYKEGFKEVEAKAGVHLGTYKVFVNGLPVADITHMNKKLYENLHKKAKIKSGIYYSPPNFLRMLMYLELSRPEGNVGRWEKVFKRLVLLNKHFPIKVEKCDPNDIQRSFKIRDAKTLKTYSKHASSSKDVEKKTSEEYISSIFETTLDTLIKEKVVFFGAYANKMYLRRLSKFRNRKIPTIPDFDVLSSEAKETSKKVKNALENAGIQDVEIKKQPGLGEIIPIHYQITVRGNSICFIYETIACHSFNKVKINNREIKVATIDTILSFYIAFIYGDREYYDKKRLLCMSNYIFMVRQKNRLKKFGLLGRFSETCYGKQITLEEMRINRNQKYKELRKDKNQQEWKKHFFKYVPKSKRVKKSNKVNTKTRKKKHVKGGKRFKYGGKRNKSNKSNKSDKRNNAKRRCKTRRKRKNNRR